MNDTLLLFLDDVRLPPSVEWQIARTAQEAYEHILYAVRNCRPIIASLDHDLGEDIPTGYDLLNWLERDIVWDDNFRPDISFTIHSANPVGRANMERAIRSIERLLL